MTENKRFDVVYEEDDDYKNIRYWEIMDKKCGATTSNELKICHLLNNLNDENEQLKKENANLLGAIDLTTKNLEKQFNRKKELYKQIDDVSEENEQLKQDIRELQNDNLLTELQMKYDKKQEHIVVLENKIRRMREAIHKLEWLATHRSGELKRENEQLKQLNRNLGDFRNFITEQNVSNEKQRKELQLQLLRLYNYFENYFEDTMSPNAFSEMWDTVKESKKWEKR